MSAPRMNFMQSCPVCGRALRVRLHLVGQRVKCAHCGGAFVAGETASQALSLIDARIAKLLRTAPGQPIARSTFRDTACAVG